MGFPGNAVVKSPPANAGDAGDWALIPGSGRSPGGGHSNPLQFLAWRIPWTEEPTGLESMGFAKSWTRLSARAHTHTHTHTQTMLSYNSKLFSLLWNK